MAQEHPDELPAAKVSLKYNQATGLFRRTRKHDPDYLYVPRHRGQSDESYADEMEDKWQRARSDKKLSPEAWAFIAQARDAANDVRLRKIEKMFDDASFDKDIKKAFEALYFVTEFFDKKPSDVMKRRAFFLLSTMAKTGDAGFKTLKRGRDPHLFGCEMNYTNFIHGAANLLVTAMPNGLSKIGMVHDIFMYRRRHNIMPIELALVPHLNFIKRDTEAHRVLSWGDPVEMLEYAAHENSPLLGHALQDALKMLKAWDALETSRREEVERGEGYSTSYYFGEMARVKDGVSLPAGLSDVIRRYAGGDHPRAALFAEYMMEIEKIKAGQVEGIQHQKERARMEMRLRISALEREEAVILKVWEVPKP